ncbi:MAG: MFS transporter [Rhodospirillaceae bacterium]|nr:MFS transporter [Rhodospirillaceae bacterium]
MAEATTKSGFAGLAVYLDRRVAIMLALGISAGLPFMLIFDTLSAWLRESGLTLEVIGFFSLATLSYAFKFVWAPLVDRAPIPVLTRLLGQRRSWMLLAQFAIILGLWSISATDPTANLAMMAVFAVATGFASATQDIAMDAWRIEVSDDREQGAMVAAYTWGYRIARLIAGVVPLIVAQAFNWSLSYFVMAAMMLIGVAATLLAPREKAAALRPVADDSVPVRPVADRVEWLIRIALLAVGAAALGSGLSARADLFAFFLPPEQGVALKVLWRASIFVQLASVGVGFVLFFLAATPLPHKETRPGFFLARAFIDPFADFFRHHRGEAGLILTVICLYRVADFTLNMMNPFYLDLGFTLVEIAEVRKVWGTVMSMLGVFIAGAAMARWGLMRPFLVGAFLGPLSNLAFAWVATQGHDIPALMIAMAIDNISEAFSGACLVAYMSSLTTTGFTATQYALFASLYAIPGKLVGSQSGRIVEASAHAAEEGGFSAPFRELFTVPPEALAKGAAAIEVSSASLGAGYVSFFIYTFLVGIVAIVLTWILVRRKTA